uniref:RING-type domain-containing protein n=1 Tax=Strongyloides papillosus TaxID=174720 RepID=A0A0N5BZ87_STREA
MSLNCGICFERYTPNGTEHALCYITCGHLVGKSCLERWINLNEVDGEFSCPICNQFIVDYFPIHSIPDQVILNYIKIYIFFVVLVVSKFIR